MSRLPERVVRDFDLPIDSTRETAEDLLRELVANQSSEKIVNMEPSFLVERVSNVMSMLTIASCLFLKVPQIMHLRETQSAQGMNIQAMLMEISAFSIVTLYNFTNHYSLLTYLEYPIILMQVYVMLYYVLKYKDILREPAVPVATIAYVGAVLLFATQMLPKQILKFLLPMCTPVSGFAKVTYIYGMVRASNADAVSLKTWIISTSTNLSRLFTVYVDSGDLTLMFNLFVSSILSAGVLLTAVYYQQRRCTETPAKRTHLHDD